MKVHKVDFAAALNSFCCLKDLIKHCSCQTIFSHLTSKEFNDFVGTRQKTQNKTQKKN